MIADIDKETGLKTTNWIRKKYNTKNCEFV